MCRPVTCKRCGKHSWAGCGQHVDQVMAGVPKSAQCTCPPTSGGGGLLSALKGMFGKS